jgi:hypothetical protein
MRRMGDFINEDTNQFGPGTDLIISVLAMLLVMTIAVYALYSHEKIQYDALRTQNDASSGGNFKRADNSSFSAAEFYMNPVDELKDPYSARVKIETIVKEYLLGAQTYPYVFVIGHANRVDNPIAVDKSDSARWRRNWEYAGRRSIMIAALIGERLSSIQRDKLVVVSTGEFDLKKPSDPISPQNAWVQIIFGKEWKPPANDDDLR